jgi:hypothetical protein
LCVSPYLYPISMSTSVTISFSIAVSVDRGDRSRCCTNVSVSHCSTFPTDFSSNEMLWGGILWVGCCGVGCCEMGR